MQFSQDNQKLLKSIVDQSWDEVLLVAANSGRIIYANNAVDLIGVKATTVGTSSVG